MKNNLKSCYQIKKQSPNVMNSIPKIPFLKNIVIIFRKKSVLQQNVPFLFLVFIFFG